MKKKNFLIFLALLIANKEIYIQKFQTSDKFCDFRAPAVVTVENSCLK